MQLIEIKERPLLFKGEMIRAILKDIKTQTRRLRSLETINDFPNDYQLKGLILEKPKKDWVTVVQFIKVSTGELINIPCPYGKPGDLFWVRETWREALSETHECYAYRANMVYRCGKQMPSNDYSTIGWKPSIHMRKKIARIWLDCTSINIQRLQDISEEDATAEGVEALPYGTKEEFEQGLVLRTHPAYAIQERYDKGLAFGNPKAAFKDLWESIYGIGSWDKNPWIWIVEFKMIRNS